MIRKEDNEPVWYCRRCLSLRIKTEDGLDYCDSCGSTAVGQLPDIYEWEKLYTQKKGEPYVESPRSIIMRKK